MNKETRRAVSFWLNRLIKGMTDAGVSRNDARDAAIDVFAGRFLFGVEVHLPIFYALAGDNANPNMPEQEDNVALARRILNAADRGRG